MFTIDSVVQVGREAADPPPAGAAIEAEQPVTCSLPSPVVTYGLVGRHDAAATSAD